MTSVGAAATLLAAAWPSAGATAASEPGAQPPADFGSYPPQDVTFLLKDLSAVALERGTEDREEVIQGGGHYAEMLPVEYQPPPEYLALFERALADGADRVALATGLVTELVLASRPAPVLVSLARAGTPVGILMRRWAAARHGLDLPHYSVSIVRGRGIDRNALAWVTARHDPAAVQFVDGWTGKGAIARELTAALAALAADGGPVLDPALSVLADPGCCVPLFGTREDFLVPSACLNSTVSGLVSRTVLRADLIGPRDFHGAKYYRELAGQDLSRRFVDTVAARFPAVAARVDAELPALAGSDRAPTWDGWEAVRRVADDHGIDDLNLVKPGVGETTRVLLRRVPWKVLVDPAAGAELAHVRLLAAERRVPVEERDGLTYSCVGLIRPRIHGRRDG